jgi:hypothetical protein
MSSAMAAAVIGKFADVRELGETRMLVVSVKKLQ